MHLRHFVFSLELKLSMPLGQTNDLNTHKPQIQAARRPAVCHHLGHIQGEGIHCIVCALMCALVEEYKHVDNADKQKLCVFIE